MVLRKCAERPETLALKPILGVFVSCQQENQVEFVEINDVEMKQNVFVSNCNNCPIKINGKIKSLTISECASIAWLCTSHNRPHLDTTGNSIKTVVQIDEVVSVIEIINCKRLNVHIENAAPTVQVRPCAHSKTTSEPIP